MKHEQSDLLSKKQFRVVINRDANEVLEAFVARANSDQDNSRITKSDFANYLFSRLNDLITASDMAEIRALYFDAKKALEGILKNATDGNSLPGNLREALLKHCGIKAPQKEKRPKKSAIANGDISNLDND